MRETNQMGKCWSSHLRHDVRAVVLGRSGADTEAPGDHFVHVAIDEQGEDFPVTRRQPFKASFSLITLGGLLRNRLATRECFIKNLKQGSGSSGFSMKCRRRRAWPRQF